MTMLLVCAVLIGVVAGMRAMLAPAAVSWAAHAGVLVLAGTPLAFLGWRYTPWILLLLAIGEMISDKLPRTPSRKVPMQFITRLLTGALAGAAVGAHGGQLLAGVLAGLVGAVIGTYVGAAMRAALAARLGRDLPAALIEDLVAIALSLSLAMLR